MEDVLGIYIWTVVLFVWSIFIIVNWFEYREIAKDNPDDRISIYFGVLLPVIMVGFIVWNLFIGRLGEKFLSPVWILYIVVSYYGNKLYKRV